MAIFGKRRDGGPPVVDLREQRAEPEFGRPTRCPRCGRPGYLDHIDLRARAQHQHCPSCEHRWVTTEAELSGSQA